MTSRTRRSKSTAFRSIRPGAAGFLAASLVPLLAHAACCYFSAKEKDVLQPAQKAFITWDPVEKVAQVRG